MNQAEVAKLMSQLKVAVKPRHRNLKVAMEYGEFAPGKGRLDKLRKTVTALVKYERLEMNYNRADEARGYAERLISDAIRNGDTHKSTMEMADFWLLEKQLVHKLFKVLVPRFENYNKSCTRMYKAPREYPGHYRARSILELRENPYPSLVPDLEKNRFLIHNILLDEARKEKQREWNIQRSNEKASEEVTTEKVEEIKEPEK